MSAAAFALLGTLMGAVGALAGQAMTNRAESRRARRAAVLRSAQDFTAALSTMRSAAYDLADEPEVPAARRAMAVANRDARTAYENVRLTIASVRAQKAGRHALRYAYGMQLLAEGARPRPDEVPDGPAALHHRWLAAFYAEVRRELGIADPDNVFSEPEEWIGFPRGPVPAPAQPEADGG